MTGRARIVFLIRVAERDWAGFRAAYDDVRQLVAGTPGHLCDQVCQSTTDPEQWLITSEWRSLHEFEAWERTEEHRTMVKPMRERMTETRSLRFVIRAETPGPVEVGS
ncbi:MAG: antibiotic biosynthesis monooxygenase family protein [Acidimicrobiales bacterium]